MTQEKINPIDAIVIYLRSICELQKEIDKTLNKK
jgi:hypothetical protein